MPSGAATNSATPATIIAAARMNTALPALLEFFFQPPPEFGIERRRRCARLRRCRRRGMPPADGNHHRTAADHDCDKRHRPGENVEALGGRRGQNFLAVLLAVKS